MQMYQKRCKWFEWFEHIVGKSPLELSSTIQEDGWDRGDMKNEVYDLINQCLDKDMDRRPTIYTVAKIMGQSLGVEWDDGYGVLESTRSSQLFSVTSMFL
jgi:hypothetical protein